MRNIGLIVVLAACVYGLWYLHQKKQLSEPVPVSQPVPVAEPQPVPVAEPEPVPAKTLDEVVRESIRAQRKIEVPHALSDHGEPWDKRLSEAVVTRVEPDGLHMRYPSGITKIGYEAIPEEWREVYSMPSPDAAEHYRVVCEQHRRKVQRHRAKAARAREQQQREQQGKRLAQLEQEKAQEEAEKEERNRRIAWRNYDVALSRYYSERKRYRYRRQRGAFGMKKPRLPVPPSFPRP